MKTLAYFASGPIKEEYKNLDFDRIYLIDNCFRRNRRFSDHIFSEGKIVCIGMDCLKSIRYLQKENVRIDYFVSLNEGLYEGGGTYAINSDMFLGYAMPLFKDQYIHIMNKNYYQNSLYNVSMDLPYSIKEIKEDDDRYLNPFIFSDYKFHHGHAKVLEMTRYDKREMTINVNPKISFKIIHDSIWNYYDKLDVCVLSFSNQGQRDFFDNIPKVITIPKLGIHNIFNLCNERKLETVGFTPFGRGSYEGFLRMLRSREKDYPKQVLLFHLNKNDYREIKNFC